jgi:hypothetical protein
VRSVATGKATLEEVFTALTTDASAAVGREAAVPEQEDEAAEQEPEA